MKKKVIEKSSELLFFLCSLISVVAVFLICLFIFARGIPAIGKIGFFGFVSGQIWKPTDAPALFGIFPMIVGSLYVTAGAIIIGVPIGVLCAIFLAKFCPKRLYGVLKPVVDLLAGIPSIVYGFFGLQLIVPIIKDYFPGNGKSVISASIVLGIMILPTIISISEAAIRAVPDYYYEGAMGLGATHEQTVFKVMLPAASSGVLTAVILGIGRAIGETMAVILVAGNAAAIPSSIFDPVRTLTANIVMEMSYASGLHLEALIATGAVLFVFILILNTSVNLVARRQKG